MATMVERIKQRRLQMLVHSLLYYGLDRPIIDDHTFDAWARELADLQREYLEESKEAPYHEDFIGFDGSTGADLDYDRPEIRDWAMRVSAYHHSKAKGDD